MKGGDAAEFVRRAATFSRRRLQWGLQRSALWVAPDPYVQQIIIDYPVRPTSRYPLGGPPHRRLHERIARQRADYERLIGRFSEVMEGFGPITAAEPPSSSEPYWDNGYLPGLDAVGLYSILALHNPRRYVEIGSGNSTRFARKAIVERRLRTEILSIDPHPVLESDHLCDEVIRRPLEEVDLELFHDLEPGDVLFVDGSHRCFTNSDVTVLFLEVLPELVPGVLLQIHDITLPYDYPQSWSDRYYSEQYLLAVALLTDRGGIDVLLPNYFVAGDHELRRLLGPLWARPELAGAALEGGSFWFRFNEAGPPGS